MSRLFPIRSGSDGAERVAVSQTVRSVPDASDSGADPAEELESERNELLLELSHVAGQLHACTDPQAAPLLIEELVDIARQLSVPTEARSEDAPAFLAAPEKIVTATWRQCGGLIYALCHARAHHAPRVATEVAQRLVRLASGRLASG